MTALGRVGVRSWQLSDADVHDACAAAVELEELGFGAVWIRAKGYFDRAAALLDATTRLVVASSVHDIWNYDAQDLARDQAALAERHPDRVLVGLGVSHRPLIDRDAAGRYRAPVESMCAFLDALDACGPPQARSTRIVAALGPRMLAIAPHRSLGTHPYIVPVEFTRRARTLLGSSATIAPAHVAYLETDVRAAREVARRHLNSPYLSLPNYANNLLRHGFVPADLENGGSDRLVDSLVAWGDGATVAAKLRAHLDAGADHVAVHVLRREGNDLPLTQWREVARELADELLARNRSDA